MFHDRDLAAVHIIKVSVIVRCLQGGTWLYNGGKHCLDLLELLLESLFKPGQHLNPEHKLKYVYLLAYAASVHETWIEVS